MGLGRPAGAGGRPQCPTPFPRARPCRPGSFFSPVPVHSCLVSPAPAWPLGTVPFPIRAEWWQPEALLIRVAQGGAGCHQAVGGRAGTMSTRAPAPLATARRQQPAVRRGASPQAGRGCARSAERRGLGGFTPGRWVAPVPAPSSLRPKEGRAQESGERGRPRDLSPLRAWRRTRACPAAGRKMSGGVPAPSAAFVREGRGRPRRGCAPRAPGRRRDAPSRCRRGPARRGPGPALTRWSRRPRGAGARGQVQVQPRGPSQVPARSPGGVRPRKPQRPAGALLSPWPRHPNFVHSRRAGSFRASRTLGWVSAATSELGNKEGESRPGEREEEDCRRGPAQKAPELEIPPTRLLGFVFFLGGKQERPAPGRDALPRALVPLWGGLLWHLAFDSPLPRVWE